MAKQLNKKELLKLIDELEKNPDGKFQIFADVGLLTAGAVAGGILAAELGATALLFGLVTISAPISLVVGGSVLGGMALVGAKKWLFDGNFYDGKRAELLRQYQEQLKNIETKEKASKITDKDKTKFHILLREPINLDLIKPKDAQELIEAVENGHIPLHEAYQLVMNILKEQKK